MSLLQSALRETLPRVPERLDELSALMDPAWIEQALTASGKASIRRRKLRAGHAVWLVIGLALFRNRPLWQVVQQLGLSLDGQTLPVVSVSVQARQRLGEEPLAELFTLLTRAWSRATLVPTQQPLRVLAVDGVVWSAPDVSGTPIIPSFSAAFLLDWQSAGQHRHWLMRAKDNLRHEIIEQLAQGDVLIRMPISPQACKARPQLPTHRQAWLIEVSVGGWVRRFITSLQNYQTHPARQLAQRYRQRWEIELGFKESNSPYRGASRCCAANSQSWCARSFGASDRLYAAAALDA